MPRCKICHRQLKDQISIEREYGPTCFKKISKSVEQLEIDFEADVVTAIECDFAETPTMKPNTIIDSGLSILQQYEIVKRRLGN